MTLDEMKFAVCEKLPECMTRIGPRYCWKKDNKVSGDVCNVNINWPTEGLQVCHEAEKVMTAMEYLKWWATLCRVVWGSPITMESSTRLVHEATYEQRLEALTRVWFPERWK